MSKRILEALRANNYKLFFLLMALLSIGSLGFAYFVEYALGFEPCYMCLYQRIPYFALAFAAISALALKNGRGFMILTILIFLSSVILAGYHTGIERGIFNPTDMCNSGGFIESDMSNEDILEKLYDAPIADCSKPAFKIFGISMTEWNLLLSLVLFIMGIIVAGSPGLRPRMTRL